MLRGGDERDAVGFEDLPELVEVLERARDAVDLVGDDGVELAGADVIQQLLDARPLEVLAGVARVLVDAGDLQPFSAWMSM